MAAKEDLRTKEYIELRMSDNQRSTVKGDSKVDTEVRLIADTAKTCEHIIPPFCRICFDESNSPQAPILDPSSKSRVPPAPTDNPLLTPCMCSGTTAAVHLICLQRWQAFSKSDSCELCHSQFNIPKELSIKQDISPSETPSVNHPPPGAFRQFFRRLFMLVILLCLQLIPIAVVVLIMTVQVEEQQETTPAAESLGISWILFGRATLSVLVCLLYIPLLYVCLFKHRQFLKHFTSQNGRRNTSYTSMRRESSHHSYLWHRRQDERSHYFLEAAFI